MRAKGEAMFKDKTSTNLGLAIVCLPSSRHMPLALVYLKGYTMAWKVLCLGSCHMWMVSC